ncbi:glycosyltransferase family 2 protein [Pelagicoccus sp. SDUM812002]|uniref:glycosyltransferase family 2 protein n=1 Tax=Pelagicoccus sp. SDUM812002 TaxID=3041266 RepID=UPI00280DABFC|nr:glycosyltransferase family 2 protein [Pelagicoccus sp. SDUM812002]MDQ8186366.1 glycosyltransferase family 2 protein [Pelagicoccus sp. SDUM812002]
MNVKPLVLIPSYNSGKVLLPTLQDALSQSTAPVMLVIDGSTDGSELAALEFAKAEPRLTVIVKTENAGKGAAVRSGLQRAESEGFTHALVMDADGQHPAERIDPFFEYAEKTPEAMILGQPVFDANVPLERLYGRKLSVWMVQFEVGGRMVGDPLFGFRVYPIRPLLRVMEKPGRSDRYDFDPEVAVRLSWLGVPAIKVRAPVKYISREQGGVSHFHYVRDNVRFVCLHVRLALQAPYRWIARPKQPPTL